MPVFPTLQTAKDAWRAKVPSGNDKGKPHTDGPIYISVAYQLMAALTGEEATSHMSGLPAEEIAIFQKFQEYCIRTYNTPNEQLANDIAMCNIRMAKSGKSYLTFAVKMDGKLQAYGGTVKTLLTKAGGVLKPGAAPRGPLIREVNRLAPGGS